MIYYTLSTSGLSTRWHCNKTDNALHRYRVPFVQRAHQCRQTRPATLDRRPPGQDEGLLVIILPLPAGANLSGRGSPVLQSTASQLTAACSFSAATRNNLGGRKLYQSRCGVVADCRRSLTSRHSGPRRAASWRPTWVPCIWLAQRLRAQPPQNASPLVKYSSSSPPDHVNGDNSATARTEQYIAFSTALSIISGTSVTLPERHSMRAHECYL